LRMKSGIRSGRRSPPLWAPGIIPHSARIQEGRGLGERGRGRSHGMTWRYYFGQGCAIPCSRAAIEWGCWRKDAEVRAYEERRAGRRQFCRRGCALTGLTRRVPRFVPSRSISRSASGGSPGSYRPRRQSDRSSSQTQCACSCFTRTESYESLSGSSVFDGDGSRCPWAPPSKAW
jgi:hypothetical protein